MKLHLATLVLAAGACAALTSLALVDHHAGLEATAAEAEVERAVRDYVDALYMKKPELIERSVHEALEKFGTWRPQDSTEYRTPGKMTYAQLHELSGRWRDSKPGELRPAEVEVFDVLDQTASAKLVADWGIDYMHLMRFDGKWKIIQVIWQSHPPAGR